MEHLFIINNRFAVNPSLNLICDLQQHTKIQLEPRLMKVLCKLAEQPGLLVLRDNFTSQVWNDYGGADDGLTQAISFLRKALDDRSKELIKTISGKGYLLQAVITREVVMPEPVAIHKKNNYYRTLGIVATFLVVILFAHFELNPFTENDNLKKIRSTNAVEEKKQETLKPSERPTGTMESNSPKNKFDN